MIKKLNNILLKRKKCLAACIFFLAVLSVIIFTNRPEKKVVVQATQLSLNLMNPTLANSEENPYLITTVLDLYHLAEFSRYNTCEGMYFQVSPELKDAPPEKKLYYVDEDDMVDDEEGVEGAGIPYHIDLIDNLDPFSNGIQQTEDKWYGIGMNFCYPFMGHIDFQGISIKTDTNMFGFLSDGAVVRGLRVFGDITSEKNNEFYGITYAPIGGIASIAYITDTNGANASVTVTNCYVTDATITGNLSSNFGSVGGIIGLCYGRNSVYGKTEPGAVNFNIETCGVNAEIKCAGARATNYGTNLGNGSNNGVINGTFDPSKVTNSGIGVNFSGYAGGLIGDVTSLNGTYYINVNIKGDNQVFGKIESKSASGGAIGHIHNNVHAKFTGSLSFKDNTDKLSEIIYGTSKTGETIYSGLFVGSGELSLITVNKDENGNNFVFVNNNDDIYDIPESGNSVTIGTPVNVLLYPNYSQGAKIRGLGTDADPYLLSSPNDFSLLTTYLSSEGRYGLGSFDTSAMPADETVFNYIRKASYRITNDINISNTGINTINRRSNSGFSGKFIGEIKNGVKPVLTFNRDTYQDDTGLFTYLTPMKNTQVIFRDFDLTGTIKGRARAAGITQYAYYHSPSGYNGDIIFENIDNTLNLSCYYDVQQRNSPFISEFEAQNMFQNIVNEGSETQHTPILEFKDLSYDGIVNAFNWDYGALIGYIRLPNNKYGYRMKLDIENFDLSGELNYVSKAHNNNSYVAGLIGGTSIYNTSGSQVTFPAAISGTGSDYAKENYLAQRSIINITNFNATDFNITVKNDLEYYIGGILTRAFRGVDVNINNVNVTNCSANVYRGYYGGLISKLEDTITNISNVNYNGYTIYQRAANSNSYAGGLVGYTDAAGSVLCNISNFDIENCKIIGNNRFSDIVSVNVYLHETGDAGNQEVIGTFNLIGNDEDGKPYSVTNPYIHKFAYQASLTSDPVEDYKSYIVYGRLMYNVFTSNEFSSNGTSNKSDYIIYGSGEKTDPFVIDSPEKMMILQLMSNTRFRASVDLYGEYFDFVELDYFSGVELGTQKKNYVTKIYTGYYVFSKDIDLKNYSFATITGRGGRYYGFNASKYLTDKGRDVTDANIKEVCVDAIDVLERHQAIIKEYEDAFETEYIAFLAENGSSYVFKNTDKSIVEDRVRTNHPDIYNEYQTLKEYNRYKPEIKFSADEIANCDKVAAGYTYLNVKGSVASRQARGMHSGLFSNVYYCKGERKLEINNIKMAGTFSGARYYDTTLTNGGTLITNGYVSYSIRDSIVNISNIDFGDVTMLNSASTSSTYGAGLLLDSIYASVIDIYGITVLPGANITADALIGYQYGDVTKVEFEHIDLNEALDSFKYGLFYYNYNQGLSIYWYDDGDFEATRINTDIVTPGIVNIEGEKRVINRVVIEDETYTYAYKSNKIEINPVTKHIIHGNGTKEDPFVISNMAQLTSLALAFKGLGQIAGMEEWFVGEIKNNPNFDPDDHTTWELNGAHNYVTWKFSDSESVRKTNMEHIRSAYYVITEDINLYDVPQEYEKFEIAAQGFLGLGTETFPFSGSFDGSYSYDETTKTLSKKSVNSTITLNTYQGDKAYQYGLIKYANGVNISNLNIETPKDENGNYIGVVMASATAQYGMAIAYITGGDNVIDNVTAKGVVYEEVANGNICAGGLVGYLMSGTLTFTNMQKDAVKEFKAYYYKEETNGTITLKDTNNAGGYIGRVYYTGVCFIDGDEDIFLPTENVYSTFPEDAYENDANHLPIRANYGNFINKNYLNDMGKIKVTGTASTGFKAQLANEKQVYLLSLALRCGALGVNTTYYQNINDNTYYPYGYYCRTYKINDDDNTNFNPAIYEYFDLDDVTPSYDANGKLLTLTDSGAGAITYRYYRDNMNNMAGYTMLNQISTVTANYENGEFRTEFNLNEDDYYDMSQIPDFSGFGTRYALNNKDMTLVYSFASDFNGNGSTIYYVLEPHTNGNKVKSALFNGYYDRDIVQSDKKYAIKFKNLVLSGEITSGSTSNDVGQAAYSGALIGYMYTRKYFEISNVTVKDFKITNNGYYMYSGGLIGANTYDYNLGNSTYANMNVTFKDIKIGDEVTANSPQVDGKPYSIVMDMGAKGFLDAGGVYGYTTYLDIKGINVKNLYINNKYNTGGIVGRMNLYGIYNYLEDITVSNCTFINSTGAVGGVIGRLAKTAAQFDRSLSGKKIIINDVDILATDANALAAKLIGNQEGVHETGFVDIRFEYSDDFTGNIPEAVWNKTVGNEKKSEYFYINEFTDIEEVEKEEGIKGISEPDVDKQDAGIKYGELISTQQLVDLGEKQYLFTDEDGNPLDLIPDNGRDDDFLIVEWVTDAGTIEEVLNSILNTLTKGTGLFNNLHEDATGDTNENISVEILPMQVLNGVVSQSNATPSVSITKNAKGNFVITNNNIYDKIEKTNSAGEHVPGTYSLIKISYNVSVDATRDGVGYTETICIPFMVSNMISADSYYRVELGENYDASYLHNLTNMGLTITKDSSFTVYSEIMYSSNRSFFKEEEVYYVKEFVLDPKKPVIPKGTKLTMIDITDDGSKTYYYEVKDYRTSVRLTEFVDEYGNHYEERNISDYNALRSYQVYRAMAVNGKSATKRRYGVEKFVMFVDNTDLEAVANITGEESVWKPGIVNAGGFSPEDLALKQQETTKEILTSDIFYEKNRCATVLNTYNGRQIGFVDDSLSTDGSISEVENLKVNVSFFNKASTTYWDYINNMYTQTLNDYANSGKYLEICISLVNEAGEKILLPAGTMIRYGNNVDFEGIKSTSHVYYYKDAGTGGFYLMDVSEDTITDMQIELNFSNARMENLPAGNYYMELELLRTGNKDFPMGSEVLDVVKTELISVTDAVEYGFSISGYDKEKLAYNKKYDGESTGGFVLDYNISLSSSFALDLTADKSVKITYELLEKNPETGLYEAYVPVNGIYPQLIIGDMSSTGYTVIDGSDVICSGSEGTIDITDTTDEFTSLLQSITVQDVPGAGEDILEIPFTLSMPDNANAVNYKIVAKLYTGIEEVKEAEDMVIFNISDISLE